MSRTASVELNFADGKHAFRLRIAELIELQEKCDAGPAYIRQRLISGHYLVQDVRETIRLGLIGAGMPSPEAVSLVARYVDEKPLEDNIMLAEIIVTAAVIGVEDEDIPKSEGETEEPPISPQANSASGKSSDPDSASDFPSAK